MDELKSIGRNNDLSPEGELYVSTSNLRTLRTEKSDYTSWFSFDSDGNVNGGFQMFLKSLNKTEVQKYFTSVFEKLTQLETYGVLPKPGWGKTIPNSKETNKDLIVKICNFYASEKGLNISFEGDLNSYTQKHALLLGECLTRMMYDNNFKVIDPSDPDKDLKQIRANYAAYGDNDFRISWAKFFGPDIAKEILKDKANFAIKSIEQIVNDDPSFKSDESKDGFSKKYRKLVPLAAWLSMPVAFLLLREDIQNYIKGNKTAIESTIDHRVNSVSSTKPITEPLVSLPSLVQTTVISVTPINPTSNIVLDEYSLFFKTFLDGAQELSNMYSSGKSNDLVSEKQKKLLADLEKTIQKIESDKVLHPAQSSYYEDVIGKFKLVSEDLNSWNFTFKFDESLTLFKKDAEIAAKGTDFDSLVSALQKFAVKKRDYELDLVLYRGDSALKVKELNFAYAKILNSSLIAFSSFIDNQSTLQSVQELEFALKSASEKRAKLIPFVQPDSAQLNLLNKDYLNGSELNSLNQDYLKLRSAYEKRFLLNESIVPNPEINQYFSFIEQSKKLSELTMLEDALMKSAKLREQIINSASPKDKTAINSAYLALRSRYEQVYSSRNKN